MDKKILIINPFGIGDVLFTTPIIHTLKEVFSPVKIGYLCNRRTVQILENNPYLDRIFVYERDEFEAIRRKSLVGWIKASLSFLNKIKKERFELVFDFSLNAQYGFFSWYAGIRERIGYDYKGRGWILNKKVKLAGYNQKHVIEYYGELLKKIDIELQHRNPELYLKEEDIIQARRILEKKGVSVSDAVIGIIPGAGRSWGRDASLKHWPYRNYAQLADKIIEKYGATIIIMGDFYENEIAKNTIECMKNKEKAIDLSGMTSIVELAAILSLMKLVITNDGGPLHMAVALGVKTISFFGPVDPVVYGPFPPDPKQHVVLRSNLECSPCYSNFRLTGCVRNKECLTGIDVGQAMGAVEDLWS